MDVKPVVKYSSPLLQLFSPKVNAITIGRTIYVRHAVISESDLQHEAWHVKQFAERGATWRGVCEYLLLALLYGYASHPWEVEARRAERGICPAGACAAIGQQCTHAQPVWNNRKQKRQRA
jgi:hypothetical protein